MDVKYFVSTFVMFALVSCGGKVEIPGNADPQEVAVDLSLGGVARILSVLPLEGSHLTEVHDAVSASSGNGFDEEYMMCDLFSNPGAGVGSEGAHVKSSGGGRALRDLFEDYFNAAPQTKSGNGARECIEALTGSDIQIYWPYSEDWDGETYPIVTFDPGYGAESNYGYEIRPGGNGMQVVDSVLVDEAVAMTRPVWVINRNDDSAFTPAQLISGPALTKAGGKNLLKMKSFNMLRNYDSWFGGASEFLVKCGAVDGFKATKDEDLKLYTPTVTDFVINIRRKQLKERVPLDCILLTDFTEQMENIVFMVIEDDGGVSTSWKAAATVKYNSKSYGFDLDLPYKDRDDIVWRGQLGRSFFFNEKDEARSSIKGRFGDVEITFGLE